MLSTNSFVCLAGLALCSGCVHGATAVRMTALADGVPHPSPLTAIAVTVGDVSGGTKTSQMWTSQVDDDAFRAALTESLRAAGVLAEGRGTFTLNAVLVSLNQPLVGFDMSVTATVWCTLIDDATGEVAWQDMFAASSTATVGDALVGVVRLQRANEGAMRGALTKIVQRLAATPHASAVAVPPPS